MDTKDGRLAKYQVRGLSTIVGCNKLVITLFAFSGSVEWVAERGVQV